MGKIKKYKNYINEYNKYDTSSMSEDYNYCKKKSLSGIPKALIKYIVKLVYVKN